MIGQDLYTILKKIILKARCESSLSSSFRWDSHGAVVHIPVAQKATASRDRDTGKWWVFDEGYNIPLTRIYRTKS